MNQLFLIFNAAWRKGPPGTGDHPDLDETRTLLYIACHEGRAQGEYEDGLGLTQGSVARHCATLGQDQFQWNKDRELIKPYKMIESRPKPGNRLTKQLYVTDKGWAYINSLLAMMGASARKATSHGD